MQEGKRDQDEDDGTGLTLKDLKLMFQEKGADFLSKVVHQNLFSCLLPTPVQCKNLVVLLLLGSTPPFLLAASLLVDVLRPNRVLLPVEG